MAEKIAVAQSAAAQLRALGIKVTPGRVRALDALQSALQPLTHAQVEQALGGSAIDRVTLYRVLDSLVSCGLALKAVDAGGVYRFSAAAVQGRHGDHVHFRCTGCGGVFCLKAVPPPPPKLPQGFRLGAVELDVRGTCANCTARPAA